MWLSTHTHRFTKMAPKYLSYLSRDSWIFSLFHIYFLFLFSQWITRVSIEESYKNKMLFPSAETLGPRAKQSRPSADLSCESLLPLAGRQGSSGMDCGCSSPRTWFLLIVCFCELPGQIWPSVYSVEIPWKRWVFTCFCVNNLVRNWHSYLSSSCCCCCCYYYYY